jgi:hypothetical protein
MSKKASQIYLALAPVLFFLSWYISKKLYAIFMANGQNTAQVQDRSMLYAFFFAGLYVAAWFVIQDLYKPKSNQH